nr:hypothetical protein [uncultured archaeon]
MGHLNISEFTSENLKNYAEQCIFLGMDMAKHNFDTLLIPSRGAVPVFLGSLFALKYLGKTEESYKKFVERMTAPASIREGILPKTIERKAEDNDIEILPYPLTADVNVERYNKGAKNDFYSTEIRKFSVQVLKNFFKKPYERLEDPHFKFFSNILTKIEKRDRLALEYATYPQVKNLAMIDTVISGKASSTILEAFGKEKIYPTSFLFVDQNGEKIKPEYGVKLGYGKFGGMDHLLYQKRDGKPARGRDGKAIKTEIEIDRRKIKPYDVNRIMTEDTGSALQGVSAVTYPVITIEGRWNLSPPLKYVGAGTWYAVPREKNHRKIFYHFINTLKSAINLGCGNILNESAESITQKEEFFEKKREHLVEILRTTKLPRIEKGNLQVYYPEYDTNLVEDVHESGAQVLQVAFTKEFTDEFIEGFKEEIGISPKKESKEGLEKLL